MKNKNTICLWFDHDAEAAARFYAETFPDSVVSAVHCAPGDYPAGKAGDVLTVEFTVFGVACLGLNGGPAIKHNWAFSFQIATDDQAETDRYWNAIVGNGGAASECGWCKDKWGLSWQITPRVLSDAMAAGGDVAKRAFAAMMQMGKIDVAKIEAAVRGAGTPAASMSAQKITVETSIKAPIADVWRAYTTPSEITQWNAASEDWHTTTASVDLRVGGQFCSRMEAKDGSAGFDFAGIYTEIVEHKRIAYVFGERSALVEFIEADNALGDNALGDNALGENALGDNAAANNAVTLRVTFDAEDSHSIEQQRGGWQAILNNFARHVEAKQATHTKN